MSGNEIRNGHPRHNGTLAFSALHLYRSHSQQSAGYNLGVAEMRPDRRRRGLLVLQLHRLQPCKAADRGSSVEEDFGPIGNRPGRLRRRPNC